MFKSITGQRIESYIAETFPNLGEADSATTPDGFAVRTFNLGQVIGYGKDDEPIEAVCDSLVSNALRQLQQAFGPQSRAEKFWWRERPVFTIQTVTDGSTAVVFHMRFGITGWELGQSLGQFLGLTEDFFGEVRR